MCARLTRPASGRTAIAAAVAAPALMVVGLLSACSGAASGAQSSGAAVRSGSGGTGSNGSAAGGTATGSASGSASPGGDQAFTALPADTGRLLQTTLVGTTSGVTMKVWVWLPPQYDEPAYAHTSFPALMLYPGGTGAGRNAWVGTSLGARRSDVAGVAAKTMSPFIFVMPSMQVSDSLDTECADLPGHPKVGTFLSVDVRAMVEANFRVITGRRGWGAAGTSSGAYCAARLVFDHPDQYAALVSIGGYFSIETTLTGATDPTVRAGDPAAVAVARPPAVSVLLWAGSSNDIAVAQRFLTLVRPPTHAQLRIQPGGAHLTVDFAKLVPPTLTYLSQELSRPSPAS